MKYLVKLCMGLLLPLLFICSQGLAQKTDPVAENMLLYQRADGGWTKSWKKFVIDYKKQLTEEEKEKVQAEVRDEKHTSTIDNKATTTEIMYLVKAYKQTRNKQYLAAAERGIQYLLDSQYANGGWPADLLSERYPAWLRTISSFDKDSN